MYLKKLENKIRRILEMQGDKEPIWTIFKSSFPDGSTHYGTLKGSKKSSTYKSKVEALANGDTNITPFLKRIKENGDKTIFERIFSSSDRDEVHQKCKELIKSDNRSINKGAEKTKKLDAWYIYKITFEDGGTYYDIQKNRRTIEGYKGALKSNIKSGLKSKLYNKLRTSNFDDLEFELVETYTDPERAKNAREELISEDPNVIKKVKKDVNAAPIPRTGEKKVDTWYIYKTIFPDGGTYYDIQKNRRSIDAYKGVLKSNIKSGLRSTLYNKLAETNFDDLEFEFVKSFTDPEVAKIERLEIAKADPNLINRKSKTKETPIKNVKEKNYKNIITLFKSTFPDGTTHYGTLKGDTRVDAYISKLKSLAKGDLVTPFIKKLREININDLNIDVLLSSNNKEEVSNKFKELVKTDSRSINKGSENTKKVDMWYIFKTTFPDGGTYYDVQKNRRTIVAYKGAVKSNVKTGLKSKLYNKLSGLNIDEVKFELLDSFNNQDEAKEFRKEYMLEDDKCITKPKEDLAPVIKKTKEPKNENIDSYSIFKTIFPSGETHYGTMRGKSDPKYYKKYLEYQSKQDLTTSQFLSMVRKTKIEDIVVEYIETFNTREEAKNEIRNIVKGDDNAINKMRDKELKFKVFKTTLPKGETHYGFAKINGAKEYKSYIISCAKSNKIVSLLMSLIRDLKNPEEIEVEEIFESDDREQAMSKVKELALADQESINGIKKERVEDYYHKNEWSIFRTTFPDHETHYSSIKGVYRPSIFANNVISQAKHKSKMHRNTFLDKVLSTNIKDLKFERMFTSNDKDEVDKKIKELATNDSNCINRLSSIGLKRTESKGVEKIKVHIDYIFDKSPSGDVFVSLTYADDKKNNLTKRVDFGKRITFGGKTYVKIKNKNNIVVWGTPSIKYPTKDDKSLEMDQYTTADDIMKFFKIGKYKPKKEDF